MSCNHNKQIKKDIETTNQEIDDVFTKLDKLNKDIEKHNNLNDNEIDSLKYRYDQSKPPAENNEDSLINYMIRNNSNGNVD